MNSNKQKNENQAPLSVDADRDLQHFLHLAKDQLAFNLRKIQTSHGYSERVNRMRMLEELIKEQIPDEDSRTSTRPSR